ncbi:MAG: lysophospholipid acyltransferase family protein [Candidatus Kapabacteria bacterium]|jgi:KDO2-lipid IV(A) lauroyltransferase|nr:lysophospholipid acyltransferase family protein [Candidatus Kapabacteria bacterium]
MRLIDYISHYFLMLLSAISSRLSMKSRNKLGRMLGGILQRLSKERRNVTLRNLSESLPNLSPAEHNKICRNSYDNLGITLAELLAFPSMSEADFKNYVKITNTELVEEKIKSGKGIILLSGHFGNWELMAYVAGLVLNLPITIIVKPQSNKLSDKYLNKFRTQGGNKIVPMSNAARTILQALKKNEAIALLVDQSADWQKDVFVDFFGRPAATYEAPAVIALKYGSPIITGFAHRLPDCTYLVELKELDYSDLDDSHESIIELTRRHVKVLEDNIMMNPGLWSWQHKRWKHEPPELKQ